VGEDDGAPPARPRPDENRDGPALVTSIEIELNEIEAQSDENERCGPGDGLLTPVRHGADTPAAPGELDYLKRCPVEPGAQLGFDEQAAAAEAPMRDRLRPR